MDFVIAETLRCRAGLGALVAALAAGLPPATAQPAAQPLVVEIVVTPGATLLDFAGPAEVFGAAPTEPAEHVAGPMDQRLGRAAARRIAARLEYQGEAWKTNEAWAADR